MVRDSNKSIKLKKSPILLLDCQTTGASPRTGNLLEIAWSRSSYDSSLDDNVVSRLVKQPEDQDIPARIESLTGITNDDLEEAISPTKIAKELKSIAKTFNDKPLCVIHYARFETPFLDDLFSRYGNRKTLPFEIVCTFEIAKRLYPNLPSRGIRAIGGFLGLELHDLKRASQHVITTNEIWKHLVDRLAEDKVNTLDDLSEFLNQKAAKRSGKLEYPLEPSKRLNLPDQPGVYQMLNRYGKVLYVGKATSLKSRVNSHFRGRKAKTSKSFELLTQVTDLKVETCNSPLEASLVEADLIKEYEPSYNTSLKTNKRQLWFYSTDFTKSSNKQSKKYPIGPFSSSNIVDDVYELSTCLEKNTNYCGNLYGIEDGELIFEGLDLFVDRYCDDLEGQFSIRDLLLLGLKIYRWKRNLLRAAQLEELADIEESEIADLIDQIQQDNLDGDSEPLEDDEEDDEDELEVELTPLDVLGRFESMLVYFARAYLSAKELTKLLDAKIAYQHRGTDCITKIHDGAVITKSTKKKFSTAKRDLDWKKLDLVTFDRVRVLKTEIGRMRTDGKKVDVEPQVYFLSRWNMI